MACGTQLSGAAIHDRRRVARLQGAGHVSVEVCVQCLPLCVVEQYVGPLLAQKLHCLLWCPLVPLHEVAADEGGATCPARLAVHVDRLPRAFKALDELHPPLELLLAGGLKDVRRAQLQELDPALLPLFLAGDPIPQLEVLVH